MCNRRKRHTVFAARIRSDSVCHQAGRIQQNEAGRRARQPDVQAHRIRCLRRGGLFDSKPDRRHRYRNAPPHSARSQAIRIRLGSRPYFVVHRLRIIHSERAEQKPFRSDGPCSFMISHSSSVLSKHIQCVVRIPDHILPFTGGKMIF